MKRLAHVRDLIVEALNRSLMAEPEGMLGGLKARAPSELEQTPSGPVKPLSGYGRVASSLSARLASESKKKALRVLRKPMVAELRSRVPIAAISRTVQASKRKVLAGFALALSDLGRIKAGLGDRVFNDSNRKALHDLRDRTLFELRRSLLNESRMKLLKESKRRAMVEYAELKTRSTTRLTSRWLLLVTGVWTLATVPMRFGLPWSYASDVAGYGAIIVTALTTARLTMPSRFPKLEASYLLTRFSGLGRVWSSLSTRLVSESNEKALKDLRNRLVTSTAALAGPVKFGRWERTPSTAASILDGLKSRLLVEFRISVAPGTARRLYSCSKTAALAEAARFRSWVLTPLTALERYVKFREWLGTPLTPRSIIEGLRGWILVDLRGRDLACATGRKLSASKAATVAEFARLRSWLLTPVTALTEYVKFREWLGTPLTTLSLLPLAGVWALAIIPLRFGLPWSYLGDTSGFGAILMTALTTARLTMTSPQLPPPPLKLGEPGKAPAPQTKFGPARRGVVLREIEEFFESDSRIGPRETNLKNQAFLMRNRDWQSLQDAIYDTFLKGAPPLLFEMGERLGTSIARDLERISPRPGAMLSHLEEASRASGWGIISVHGDLSLGKKLTFRVQESPFCSCKSPLENNTYSCHLVSGLVTGIVERIYGWPYSSIERRCIRDGHDCCEIVVTQSMSPVKPPRRWNLSVLFPVLEPWR
jgi:predicted hydrocarbon binding protein